MSTNTSSIGGGTWSVASTTPFFGLTWTAHDGVTFGPGTYTIDTVEGGVYTGIEVGAGQVGGHILFDWGVTTNIDVVNVWDVTGGTTYFSTDIDGDGINNDYDLFPFNPNESFDSDMDGIGKGIVIE